MIPGIFTSHSSWHGDRQGDFQTRLLVTQKGGTIPLTALSAGIPKEGLTDTAYSWREHDRITGYTEAAAAALANAVTITVKDRNIWLPSSVILNQDTGEQMYVTDVTDNVITVVRGFAGTLPAAVDLDAPLQYIASAFGEGTEGAEQVMATGDLYTSYAQIFKAAWGVTGTAKAISFRTGSKLAESKQEAMDQLTESLERAGMFGRPSRSIVTVGGKQVELRTTAGLQYAIETYGGQVVAAAANSVAGRLNLKIVTDFIRDCFDYNVKGQPNERISFTGSGFVSLLNDMIMDLKGYRFEAGENTFGIKVMKLMTPFGDVSLSTHPMFNENPQWRNEFWLAHPGGMKRRELRGLEVAPHGYKGQVTGLDAETGHMQMEMGYQFSGVKCMGILSGATSAGGLAALPNS